MNDLAVQIAAFDNVVIDDLDVADTGCRQVLQDGSSEPARADNSDARLQKPGLAFFAETGQAHLSAEAIRVLRCQIEVRLISHCVTPIPRNPSAGSWPVTSPSKLLEATAPCRRVGIRPARAAQ